MVMKVSYLMLFNFVFVAMLLVSPFVVGMTSSAWDSWLDTNDDGIIDITDIATIISNYGTMGDTTKNVTVARRSNKLAYNVSGQLVVAEGTFYTPWISVDGYSKVSICLYTSALSNYYQLETRHEGGFVFYADTRTNFVFDIVETYDVPNEQIRIFFRNDEAIDNKHIWIDIYLVP